MFFGHTVIPEIDILEPLSLSHPKLLLLRHLPYNKYSIVHATNQTSVYKTIECYMKQTGFYKTTAKRLLSGNIDLNQNSYSYTQKRKI